MARYLEDNLSDIGFATQRNEALFANNKLFVILDAIFTAVIPLLIELSRAPLKSHCQALDANLREQQSLGPLQRPYRLTS